MLPLLIIIVAMLLRIWNVGELSMSNDELSALFRLEASSIAELWQKGVMVDGHPAFVQTFLYLWLQIFPQDPLMIRLPFVLAGVFSVFFAYRIALKQVGEGAALLTSVTMACMQYFIIYSQLARPYAFGLLFTLMAYDAWSRCMLEKDRKLGLIDWLYFLMSSVLAMYTHYFSFLMVILLGVAGLFFMGSANRKGYLISGMLMIVLFIPHIHITVRQLSEGGVGGPQGWLDKPRYDFLYHYFFYAFNKSWYVIAVLLAVLLMSWIKYKKHEYRSMLRCRILWFGLWILPIIIGFYYSRWRNPVLQYSVVIFSFPFLLFYLFSFIKGLSRNMQMGAAIVMLLVGLYSTVIEKKYFQRTHWAEFKDLALRITEWKCRYDNNIYQLVAANAPGYLGFYLNRNTDGINADEYIQALPEDWTSFRKKIKQVPTQYLSFCWSNQVIPIEWFEFVRESYPHLLYRQYYFNSETWLFSRDGTQEGLKDEVQKKLFFSPHQGWQTEFVADSIIWTTQEEYISTIEIPIRELIIHKSDILYMHGIFETRDACNLHMAFSVHTPSGKTVFWEARQSKLQCEDGILCSFWHAMRFTFKPMPWNGTLKAYIWNPDACDVDIKGLSIEVRPGNPIIYGYD